LKTQSFIYTCLILSLLFLSSCGGAKTPIPDGKLHALATTSIVADVVEQVGGNIITVSTLIPIGTDPHEYSPRPKDMAAIANADVIFANGAGLEEFLSPLLESGGGSQKLVEISNGIELLTLGGTAAGQKPSTDPHTWMDPNNVLVWLGNIVSGLAAVDPTHLADYQANAEAYASSLRDLDSWIHTEVEKIPTNNRLFVTDHDVLGYFSVRYGFTQLGTITGSFSTEAEPSARELAKLEDKIRGNSVKAIFLTEPSNRVLAEQLAMDVGIPVVWLYHATLTDSSGPVPTYLDFMRYNVSAIVNALK
jgi:manganese/iron transport system substrate-binding protein